MHHWNVSSSVQVQAWQLLDAKPFPEPIWLRSWRYNRLVTWFCYQLIAKPGNKTATPPWPDPLLSIPRFCWGLNLSVDCVMTELSCSIWLLSSPTQMAKRARNDNSILTKISSSSIKGYISIHLDGWITLSQCLGIHHDKTRETTNLLSLIKPQINLQSSMQFPKILILERSTWHHLFDYRDYRIKW